MDLYRFILKKDGLYVTTDTEDREPVLAILKKELTLRKVQINYQTLEQWIAANSLEPFKLTDSLNLDLGEIFDVEVDEHLLNAYLTIFPAIEGQQKTNLSDIKGMLISRGVTYGVDEVKIMIAIAENKLVRRLPIAKGREPMAGNNAEIKYYFHEKGLKIKPKELENGKVDFYNISLIQIVQKGQLLVEKIPATKGTPGITITGREIPALNGKDAILPIGKNLVLSEDCLKGYASCEGHVVIADRRISVLPVFEVNSDVDFSTGNIDFVGNVVIKGNIKDGFSVKAKGDVEIYGSVEGGHVFASGNIFIKKGVRGLKKSQVEASGSVYCNFVEYAHISAGEDVIVNEAVMHSIVNSGSTIQVGGRKGLVVGGICRAGKALICKNMGSNLATFTTIEVGLKPELRLEYKDVCGQLVHSKGNYEKTVKGIKLLGDLKEKIGNLPADKNTLLTKLLLTKSQLEKQEEDLSLIKQKLEEQIKELEDGYIKVSGVINCGVNVVIGRANKHFTTEQYKVMLRQKGVDISISPLDDEKGE